MAKTAVSHYRQSFMRRYWQWLAIGTLAVLAFFLGWLGFWEYFAEKETPRSQLDLVYMSLQLFTLESGAVDPSLPWTLELARYLAPLVTLGAVLKFIYETLRERFNWWRSWCCRDHVILCGLGRTAQCLVEALRAAGKKVVVVERDAQNDRIPMCQDLGAIVIVGDACENTILAKAGVARARHLVAFCGDDGTNMEIAVQAHRRLAAAGGRATRSLRCVAEVHDLRLCRLLRQHEDFTRADTPYELRLTNSYEQSARQLLEEHPLDGEGVSPDCNTEVHLVVIGFGAMGQSLALQAAKTGHYANGIPVRMTIADKMIDQRKNGFYGQYPFFDKSCNPEFVSCDVDEPEFPEQVGQWVDRPDARTTVVVCLDSETEGFLCALNLISAIDDDEIPIYVRATQGQSIGTLMEMACSEYRYDRSVVQAANRIFPFGGSDTWCTRQWLIGEDPDRLARAVHENFKRPSPTQAVTQQEANAEEPQATVPKRWEELSHDLRESNHQVVDHISVKLRAIGCTRSRNASDGTVVTEFTNGQIELLAQMEHRRWCAERHLAGWRHGVPRDDRRKIHPMLVSWEELDQFDSQAGKPVGTSKSLDRQQVAQIPKLLDLVGEKVVRRDKTT
jgi:hypothetical protein